jgi:hypothetical protein
MGGVNVAFPVVFLAGVEFVGVNAFVLLVVKLS